MAIATLIEWYGPFSSVEDARREAERHNVWEALYLAIGRVGRQRSSRMQYIGISNDAVSRFTDRHHVLGQIKKPEIWIGEVASQAVSGRRKKSAPTVHSLDVDVSEHAFAYLLELPLNVRKRSNPPKTSLVIYNHWYKRDFETRRGHRGHRGWPDIIDFYHGIGTSSAKLVWFSSPPETQRLDAKKIKALRRKVPLAAEHIA